VAQKEDSEFQIAKALRERIFQIPLLPQDQIVARFATIDALLYPLARRLAEEIPVVRGHFKEIVHKVASGNTLGKNFFNKLDNEDEKKEKREILKKSEIRILSQSFALLRHTSSVKNFCKVLERSSFMRGVMEEAIETFTDRMVLYEPLNEQLKKAEAEHSPDYIKYERELVELLSQMGLNWDHRSRIEKLMTDIEPLWAEYLDLRDQLISPYLRLVYTIADGFSQTDSQTLDNFQNGLLGLLRAYKCYTPSRFAAFSLVSEQWIKQSILLHIKTEVNFIKLPIANWHAFRKLEKIKARLEQKTNREAQPEEIAIEAKMAVDKVKKLYENIKLAKVLSLNQPTQNEEDQNEGPAWSLESIADAKNVQEQMEIEADYQTVRKVIASFDEEETIIFTLISGCLDLIENTDLSPVDIEREKIRQLAAKSGIGITFK
jgi:RNA polymerase sigma factor (sigma-70 family)